MTTTSNQTLTWKHFADKSPEPSLWSAIVLIVVGLGLFALLTAEGSFAAGAAMLAIAALSVPLLLKPKPRIRLHSTHVELRTQVVWRSLFAWWSLVFVVMSIAITLDIADGDNHLRPTILAVSALIIGAGLGITAIRKAGSVTISADELHITKYRVPLEGASIDTFLYNDKAPIVRVTVAPGNLVGSMKYFFLYWRYYGVDLNTLASTLQQVVRVLATDRAVTPPEIMAMLSVDPPANVPLGSSVEIPIAIRVSARESSDKR